jgi:hypothetical protein
MQSNFGQFCSGDLFSQGYNSMQCKRIFSLHYAPSISCQSYGIHYIGDKTEIKRETFLNLKIAT